MKKKTKTALKLRPVDSVYHLWGWIVLAWALYRNFLRLPEWADEFLFKPLVFVVPVIWYVVKVEKKRLESLGLTTKNLFTSIYIGLGFGFIFALEGLAVNAIKYGRLQITPIAAFEQYGLVLLLALSLATAFSEELLSRGFIFTRLIAAGKGLATASLLSTAMFVLLHVPILLTSLKLTGVTLVLFFVTDVVLGIANSLLMFNTGSLVAPILVHLFWNMTVAMYL